MSEKNNSNELEKIADKLIKEKDETKGKLNSIMNPLYIWRRNRPIQLEVLFEEFYWM